MKIIDIIGMCVRNLWRRKMRTLLTVLGVVIGSCAIIVMISLGLGSNDALQKSLEKMGDLNVITVQGAYTGGGSVMISSSGDSSEPTAVLNKETVTNIKNINGISAVFPTLTLSADKVTLKAGKNNRYIGSWIDIVGVYPEYFEQFGYKIGEGEIQADSNGNMIIFGSEAAYQFRDSKKKRNNMVWREQLPDGTFKEPFFDPIDTQVLLYVNNTKKPDENSNYGGYLSGGRAYEHKITPTAVLQRNEENYDYNATYGIMVNMEFAEQLLSDYNRLNNVKEKDITYSSLKVRVDNLDEMDKVEQQIKELGFQTYSMNTFRTEMQGQLAKQQMLLGGLAAISLFVAAVGIANTMVMSIYERTREIGVMKVLGCFISDIRKVFLLEAGCIGLLGGIIGTVLSYIISIIINAVGGQAVGMENMSWLLDGQAVKLSIVPPWLVILALIFSTLIGLVSGFYPANRAVRISALEAIKNE